MPATGLVVKDLWVLRGGRPVVRGASFHAPRGTVTAIVGPNGGGKTSLLMGIAGLASTPRGDAYMDGVEVLRLPPRRRALMVSYAAAEPLPRGLGQSVAEFVAAARYPLAGWGLGPRPEDLEAARRLLGLLGAEGLTDKPLRETSSGEAQRALVAHALARGTPLVLLDEPTSFQDIRGRLLVYQALSRYAEEHSAAVVVATHDFVLAGLHAGHVVVLRGGVVEAEGAPGEVLEPGLLQRVYGVVVAEKRLPVPVGVA